MSKSMIGSMSKTKKAGARSEERDPPKVRLLITDSGLSNGRQF